MEIKVKVKRTFGSNSIMFTESLIPQPSMAC